MLDLRPVEPDGLYLLCQTNVSLLVRGEFPFDSTKLQDVAHAPFLHLAIA